ncbi:hypothetical protein TNCV_4038911 [Trichonephila clavipes]|nr:hypothetical protein TNCV_4038911 [Trichonephila clavipes]
MLSSSNLRLSAWWRSSLGAGLVRPSLRARPRPKSVNCHDAKNRQRPCRMKVRHARVPVWLRCSRQNEIPSAISPCHSVGASLWGGN